MRFARQVSILLGISSTSLGYELLREYAGQTFFDGWDWYGSWDNLTLSNVWWVNQSVASATNLAYINPAGNAILKVDNTSVVSAGTPDMPGTRNSVRITTTDFYSLGTLWLISLRHIPFGCSVWPAFWSKGPAWPNDGEIDIIEAINLMDHNQMALHTLPGCTHDDPGKDKQKGTTIRADCGTTGGCTVAETTPGSYAEAFSANGGGVFATQFDETGINIWFWPRAEVPASITQLSSTQTSLDISAWGIPSAAYPSGPSCNITEFFPPQQIVLDIALCGHWAGTTASYTDAGCGSAGPTGDCYQDMVLGAPGTKFDNAYFEIEWMRTFSKNAVPKPVTSTTEQPTATSSPVVLVTNTESTGSSPTAGSDKAGQSGNGAMMLTSGGFGWMTLGLLGLLGGLVL
ncbi:glycoside hydrolase family 16 protein [Abortiporus biennis]|nr:glycoside hydrolase family 16 protein [Abortiporus biennis]